MTTPTTHPESESFGARLLRALHPKKPGAGPATLELNTPLLDQNDRAAARNRIRFAARRLLVVNVMSAPGAGKTTLLARTLDEFGARTPCAVIAGDLETDNDARRLRRPGVPVVQITTGSTCHLDAEMIERTVADLSLDTVRVLFIENVGNLVCPASFDLGEAVRVVLFSTAEGEDKPLKYPPMFKAAHVVVLNKIDVAGPLGFDLTAASQNVRLIASQAELLPLSAKTGEGIGRWYDFLTQRLAE